MSKERIESECHCSQFLEINRKTGQTDDISAPMMQAPCLRTLWLETLAQYAPMARQYLRRSDGRVKIQGPRKNNARRQCHHTERRCTHSERQDNGRVEVLTRFELHVITR